MVLLCITVYKFNLGQTVYDIEFSDGTKFYYYDCGQEGYIRMDDIWYKVNNAKRPPVGESV